MKYNRRNKVTGGDAVKEELYQIEEMLNKWENANQKYSLETLSEYRKRTGEFMNESLPGDEVFKTHSDLLRKVDEKGSFCPFPGDTAVFDVDDCVKDIAVRMQDVLYENCGFILSERLARNTFHVTLHDLNNEKPYEILEQSMKRSEKMTKDMIARIAGEEAYPVCVRTVSVFNMVNKSIVLGLEPADEYSCRRLMELYERFQSVVYLDYPLTLHLTLAYYKPGEYTKEQRNILKETFAELSKMCGWEFLLFDKNLLYQRFDDMNRYYTV